MLIRNEQQLQGWQIRTGRHPQLATSIRELHLSFTLPNQRRSRATDRLIQAARDLISACSCVQYLHCDVAFLPASPNLANLLGLIVNAGPHNDGWRNLFAIRARLSHLAIDGGRKKLDMEALRGVKGHISARHLTLSEWRVDDEGTPTALVDCLAQPPTRFTLRTSRIDRPAWMELIGKYGPRLRFLHVDVTRSVRIGEELYVIGDLLHFKMSDLAGCRRLSDLSLCVRDFSAVMDIDEMPSSLRRFEAVWHTSSLDFWQTPYRVYQGRDSDPRLHFTSVHDWRTSDAEDLEDAISALTEEFQAALLHTVINTETVASGVPYMAWIDGYRKQSAALAEHFETVLERVSQSLREYKKNRDAA